MTKGVSKGITFFLTIFIVLFIVLGSITLLLNIHIVKTDKEIVTLWKDKLTFEDTFVDVRDWGPLDYVRHPGISKGLMKKGYDEIVK